MTASMMPSRACPCGAHHDGDAFRALPFVSRLDESALASIVVRWPAGAVVEVRACDGCGRAIARLQKPVSSLGSEHVK